MIHINPRLYIDHANDPIAQEIMDVSGWFKTEYLTVTWQSQSDSDPTPWLLAQGWSVISMSSAITWSAYEPWGVNGQTPAEGALVTNVSTTIQMKRRKLQSELVLRKLTEEYTKAYNEGREVNAERYDDLVKIYAVMLEDTEDEILSYLNEATTTEDWVRDLIDGMDEIWPEYKADLEALLEDYGEAERARINTQFDNEIERARQDLISKGLYNSTVWTSASAGIEERRAVALLELADKLNSRGMDVADRVTKVRVEMTLQIENAAMRFLEAVQRNHLGPIEMRNGVLSAMLGFMERRSDEYPGLEGLAEIAGRLGYGEGGTVQVT